MRLKTSMSIMATARAAFFPGGVCKDPDAGFEEGPAVEQTGEMVVVGDVIQGLDALLHLKGMVDAANEFFLGEGLVGDVVDDPLAHELLEHAPVDGAGDGDGN
jgi:hypothetical protein